MEARGNQLEATDGLLDVISAGYRSGVPRKGGPFFDHLAKVFLPMAI
jgi:hypothetical protein